MEGSKMIMSDGDSGFQRGRREAREGREETQRRARIEAEDARATRDRLERGSPSAPRRSLVNILNGMVTQDAASEMAGLDAILGIRKAQRLGYRTAADHNLAHARFEKRGGPEAFNRLHPDSLRKAPQEPDLAANDPPYRKPYVTPLRATQVRDAGGAMHGARSTEDGVNSGSDHWASGNVEAIEAAWLLDAARAIIAAVKLRAMRFPEGRRD